MFKSIYAFLLSQFFFILNDNLLKNALVAFSVFQSSSGNDNITAISGALFILPFIFFSSISGNLSDKMNKKRLLFILKFFEIFFIVLCLLSVYLNNNILMYISIFFLGIQSTIYSPLRLSLVPELLSSTKGDREALLKSANGIIEGSGFIALLIGTLFGSYIIHYSYAIILLLVVSLIVYSLSLLFLFLLPNGSVGEKILIDFNIFKSSIHSIRQIYFQGVKSEVNGICFFWLMSSFTLMMFPIIVHDIMKKDVSLFTLFLAIFSVGMGVGSVSCNFITRFLKQKQIYFLFCFSTILLGMATYLKSVILIEFGLFIMSFLGGCYSVYMYSLIQEKVDKKELGLVIAGNNILNSIYMILASLLIFVSNIIHVPLSITMILIGILAMGKIFSK